MEKEEGEDAGLGGFWPFQSVLWLSERKKTLWRRETANEGLQELHGQFTHCGEWWFLGGLALSPLTMDVRSGSGCLYNWIFVPNICFLVQDTFRLVVVLSKELITHNISSSHYGIWWNRWINSYSHVSGVWPCVKISLQVVKPNSGRAAKQLFSFLN